MNDKEWYAIGLDTSQLKRDSQQAQAEIKGIGNTAVSEGTRMDGMLKNLGRAAAAYLSFQGLTQLGSHIIQVRGQFQQLGVAFETMLGSKEKADKLMAEVVQFASVTPFQLTEVAAGTKQLLAFGTEAGNIIPTLKSLGDVSAGLSVPIERLINTYGQVKTQMKLTGRELREFSMAGVPMIAELAKNLNKSEVEIGDMVTAGKIGFKDVENAFRSMTNEGGRFANLMDKQSKTITGQISNLKDNLDKMFNSIGQSNEGIINSGIAGLSNLIANYETVIDVLKGLVLVYGAAKVAMMIVNHEKKIEVAANALIATSTEVVSIAEAKATVRKGMLTAAQERLNASMLMNPYVIAAAAIAALGYGLYKYATYQTEAQKAVKAFNAEVSKEAGKVDDTFSALKAAKEGTDRYAIAKKNLISMYGQYIPQQFKDLKNLNDIEAAQKAVNEATRQGIALKTQGEATTKIREQYADKISTSQSNIFDIIKKKSGGTVAASAKYDLQDLSALLGSKDFSAMEAIRLQQDFMKKYGLADQKGMSIGSEGSRVGGNLLGLIDAIRKEKAELDVVNKETEQFISEANKRDEAKPKDKPAVAQNKTFWDEKAKDTQAQIEALDTSSKDFATEKLKLESQLKTYQSEVAKFDTKDKSKQEEKTAEDKLKAEQDFANQSLEMQRSLEAGKIAIMQDGAEKQKREAELNYQTELDRIKKAKQDYLSALNESKGFKITDKGYIKTLPDSVKGDFDQMEVNAAATKTAAITKIEKEAAEKIKSFWSGVTEAFLTGQQNEVKGINEKYDELVKEAKTGGANLYQVALINAARIKALTDSQNEYDIKSALAKIDLEEQIAANKNSIQVEGFAAEMIMSQRSFEAYKKAALQKIEVLKKSGKKEDKDQALLIDSQLAAEEFNFQMGMVKQVASEVLDVMTSITGQLEEQGYLTQEEAKFLNEGLTNAMSGKGLIGLAKQGLSESISSIISTFPETAAAKYASQIEKINQALKEQQRIIDQSKRTGGGEAALRGKILSLEQENDSYLQQLAEAQAKLDNESIWNFSFIGHEGRVKDVEDLTIAVQESQNALEDAKQDLDDFLTGGVTQNTLADTIAQAFEDGKTSVDDFASYMNKVLMDAVLNVFKDKILGDAIFTELDDFIQYALRDNKIDETEKAIIDNAMTSIAEKFTPLWNDLTGVLQLPNSTGTTSPDPLKGNVVNATEESVSLLYGQITAARVDQKMILDNSEKSVGYQFQGVGLLTSIDENTRQATDYLMKGLALQERIADNTSFNKTLKPIYEELQSINRTLNGKL